MRHLVNENAMHHCTSADADGVGVGSVRFNSRSFGSSSMAPAAMVVTDVDISDGDVAGTTP